MAFIHTTALHGKVEALMYKVYKNVRLFCQRYIHTKVAAEKSDTFGEVG